MSAFSKKSVNKYINTKINKWLYSIERDIVSNLGKDLNLSTTDKDDLSGDDYAKISTFMINLKNSIIVTGGCFTSMLQGEVPNDIDIYFNNKQIAMNIGKFYINQMIAKGALEDDNISKFITINENNDGVEFFLQSQGIATEFENDEEYKFFEQYPHDVTEKFFEAYNKKLNSNEKSNFYNVSFLTSNAITLVGGLQFIVRFCGNVNDIHNNFDFVHTLNYWTNITGVVYKQSALESTLEKRLKYIGSKFPVTTLFRMKKFIDRGWRISAGEILKIAFDVSKLDLTDINVLREQSIGMDSAYFNQVIDILKYRVNDGEGVDIDRTYLFEAIERIFNLQQNDENIKLDEYSENILE